MSDDWLAGVYETAAVRGRGAEDQGEGWVEEGEEAVRRSYGPG